MNAYMYRAAWLCEECGEETLAELVAIGATDTGDSDDFPKGPYPGLMREADTPEHCDTCGLFLENPLTSDGYEYVRERVEDSPADSVARTTWAPFYGIEEPREEVRT